MRLRSIYRLRSVYWEDEAELELERDKGAGARTHQQTHKPACMMGNWRYEVFNGIKPSQAPTSLCLSPQSESSTLGWMMVIAPNAQDLPAGTTGTRTIPPPPPPHHSENIFINPACF